MGAVSGKAGSMGALTSATSRLVSSLLIAISKIAALFSPSANALHTARFARLHEIAPLYHHNFEDLQTALLLGRAACNQIACVRPSKKQRELSNILICARPRAGKSVHAIAQLLTWGHSVVVNDVKGELYAATADYRATLGDVFVIDPTGFGSRFDLLQGKNTEDELYAAAKHLLYEANEREPVFTLRATKMLQAMFLASRAEGIPPFPYIRFLIQLGLADTVNHLYSVDPRFATRFLETNPEAADLTDKFLQSCWGTLTARLQPLLNETVIRSLTRSDFTPAELMCAEKPITIYLKLKEQDLLALSPLLRLFWTAIIDELTTTYDKRAGAGCTPVLLLIDEGGITGIPNLHISSSTLAGRGISLWFIIQSLSQLSATYGHDRAKIILGNMDTTLFYRPNDLDTAKYLEERLGSFSAYAHSQTLHSGEETSEGRSERPRPLLSIQEITQLKDTDVLVWHRAYKPLKLKRMDWRDFGLLRRRRSISPPALQPLPPITDSKQLNPQPLPPDHYPNEDDDPFPVTLDDPDNLPSDRHGLSTNRQGMADSQGSQPTTVWQR
jgi:type IV secretion system protein VirD4